MKSENEIRELLENEVLTKTFEIEFYISSINSITEKTKNEMIASLKHVTILLENCIEVIK